MFPANQLEKMLRDMYAHNNMTEELIKQRIIEEVDPERFRDITNSTLEGLAKRELNLSAIVGKSAEAKERRLVPEVIQDFFLQAGPISGVQVTQPNRQKPVYRIGKVPRNLWPIGQRLEPRFGRLGREYGQAVFDKSLLPSEPTAEWVTPGHPLFEAVREDVQELVQRDMEHGAVFLDVHPETPSRLNTFSAAIKDGRGNVLHRRLFVVEEHAEGSMTVRQPTLFLDLMPAQAGTETPPLPLNDRQDVENFLVGEALEPLLNEVTAQREHEIQTISRHMEISLNELIHRQNMRLATLMGQKESGDSTPLTAANLKTTEDRIDDLNARLDRRRAEVQQERHCAIADIQLLGRAWVLPHPERTSPGVAPFVRDDEIERIAVEAAIAYERAQGREVESVEADNRGFDLISRRPHPEDPRTALEVRFIEVKGRAAIGEVALTTNEYKTAQRLGKDFWLYVVFSCGATPELRIVQDPARLAWEPLVKIEHYRLAADRLDPHKPIDP